MAITKKRNPKFNKVRQKSAAALGELGKTTTQRKNKTASPNDELSVFTQPEVEEEVEVEEELEEMENSPTQQNVITEIETGVRGINAQDDPIVKRIIGDASPQDMAAFNEKSQRLTNEANLRDILRAYGGGQKAVDQFGAEQLLRVIRNENPGLEEFFKQKYNIR
tara:strand:+ start:177 stop:671 length:495 start_codon:yes stop_codon:yes gene_type:complete